MLNLSASDVTPPVLPIVKLWHAVAGLYFWEFFTTLGYEWRVIRGHLPYRWTIWTDLPIRKIYSITRVSTLLALVLLLVCMNDSSIEKCESQVAPTVQVAFDYLAFATTSLLLLLRITAIWNHSKTVVRIAICLWVTNVAFLLQGVVRVHFIWIPDQRICAVSDINSVGLTLIVTLVTDVLLLSIVLVGLVRFRRAGGGSFGLQGLLWKQGVAWLMLAALAEVPPVVFVILNLTDSTSLLFQVPSLVTMSTAATWMHRSLVDYASEPGPVEIASDAFWNGDLRVSTTEPAAALQITLDQIEMTVHMTTEQYLESQSSQGASRIGMEVRRCDPPNRLVVQRDLESGMGK